MRVLVISPEAGAGPLSSGLADSIDDLVHAYTSLGIEVCVYSPFYESGPSQTTPPLEEIFKGTEPVCQESFSIMKASGSPFHFVRHASYFLRHGQYNDVDQVPYWDNHLRFALLASAALTHAQASSCRPDFVHCHEWGAALAIAYARDQYADYFQNIPILFTIHNVEYDFHFLEQDIERIGLKRKDFNIDGYEFWGKVSLLKTGILYADQVIFTSNGYCHQVLNRDLAGGIRGFLEMHRGKVHGLQHGIDYSRWTPFQTSNPIAQKKQAKAQLQEELGLERSDDIFLVYCHLDKETERTTEILFTILTNLFQLPLQLVVGQPSNDQEREYFQALSQQNTGRMATVALNHGIEIPKKLLAAADLLFLSHTEEPSASLVLKALACGAIPLTGQDVGCAGLLTRFNGENFQQANALLMSDPWPDQMLRHLRTGLDLFASDREKWNQLVTNALAFRYSWETTISEYLRLAQIKPSVV
ncbi:MAG TPA: glycogen/starch synthase [Fibrobacteraceae bacterium]|nr:glycogen/starch synthase [Fibrobacteraceae bacterium]